MKIVAPKSFTYKGGDRAVLLLHGFTGSTADVRMLGRFLEKRGFTCHAPLYKGHGTDPQRLLETGPDEWWQDAVAGYHFLKEEGFEDIAVAGISLGGVFALKVGAELPVKGVVTMSAPTEGKTADDLRKRVIDYARAHKKMGGMEVGKIQSELKKLEQQPMPFLPALREVIEEVSEKLGTITAPVFVIQGLLDDPLYVDSAKRIFEEVQTEEKQLNWYEKSGHIITLGEERERVYEDIYQFLLSINNS
ncbi:alpha/beta hydrolase [Bacillus piscicola]|uniref:alpha/beta hydrolase n=1 Tax=Bacillus piscicola TaxID=1632684 RepID=UPI001F088D03|nr:alpha/beta fold hydrolase [Bacillus piscicola]